MSDTQTFTIKAMNAAGQEVVSEVQAETSDMAIAKIRTQGYFPTNIKVKASDGGSVKVEDLHLGPKHHVFTYGPWHTYECCESCHHEIEDHELGLDVCPYCGALPDSDDDENLGVFFKTETRVRRWAQTSPWWRFWNKTGYWENK